MDVAEPTTIVMFVAVMVPVFMALALRVLRSIAVVVGHLRCPSSSCGKTWQNSPKHATGTAALTCAGPCPGLSHGIPKHHDCSHIARQLHHCRTEAGRDKEALCVVILVGR